jgi:hypothetical protein
MQGKAADGAPARRASLGHVRKVENQVWLMLRREDIRSGPGGRKTFSLFDVGHQDKQYLPLRYRHAIRKLGLRRPILRTG